MDAFSELDLEYFTTDLSDHIGILRIDRPPANAHHIGMILELQSAVEAVRFDNDVRVAVLGSESDRFFSSGYDITALQEEEPDQIGYASQTSKEVIMKMRSTDTIFIAMVNGHCMGGGLEFALGCDLRFVGDGDYRIGVPEVMLGLIPGEAGTQLLPRYIGRSTALKMMVTGDPIDPQEAYDVGLFDEIYPPDAVEDEVLAFAERLVGMPNKAIGFDKLAVNEGMEMSLYDALTHERELQNQLFDTAGAEEGIGAFIEDREPDFLAAELGAETADDD